DALGRSRNRREKETVNRFGAGVRSARNDGHGGLARRRPGVVGEIRLRIDALARREKPVLKKDALEPARGGALHLEVGVAPASDPRHEAAVLVSDVDAARESEPAVDDDDLAVVAQVDWLKDERAHRQKGADLGSRTA